MSLDVTIFVNLILKVLTLVGLGVYSIFAIVMVRQEYLMAHVLEESFETVLRLLVYLHLLASIAIFVLAIVIL
jgi:hypothetical protein